MITAILVDDEKNNIENLRALLSRHCPEIEVIGTAMNAVEARTVLSELRPDVLFLDIEMPGENGFDLLRSLTDRNFEVVFVTAYDTYGVKAIKFSALDYLLKPIDVAELKKAEGRIKASIDLKRSDARLNNLLHLLDGKTGRDNQKIALPSLKETFLVPVNEIVRCESSNNYTNFLLASGAQHLVSRPIYEYEELLKPYGFLRVHQSHLVNKRHVARIVNEDSGYLVMDHADTRVPIAKNRAKEVKIELKGGYRD